MAYAAWWSGPAAPAAVLFLLGSCFLLGRMLVRWTDGVTQTLVGAAVWMSVAWVALHFPVNTRWVYVAALALPYARGFRFARRFRAPGSRTEAAALALLLFIMGAHFLVALKPEISSDGLSMHLALPMAVFRDGALGFRCPPLRLVGDARRRRHAVRRGVCVGWREIRRGRGAAVEFRFLGHDRCPNSATSRQLDSSRACFSGGDASRRTRGRVAGGGAVCLDAAGAIGHRLPVHRERLGGVRAGSVARARPLFGHGRLARTRRRGFSDRVGGGGEADRRSVPGSAGPRGRGGRGPARPVEALGDRGGAGDRGRVAAIRVCLRRHRQSRIPVRECHLPLAAVRHGPVFRRSPLSPPAFLVDALRPDVPLHAVHRRARRRGGLSVFPAARAGVVAATQAGPRRARGHRGGRRFDDSVGPAQPAVSVPGLCRCSRSSSRLWRRRRHCSREPYSAR